MLFKLESPYCRRVYLFHLKFKQYFNRRPLFAELGANLAGQDRLENAEEEETMSTSGVSTVNSTKQLKSGGAGQKSDSSKYISEEITGLKVENVRLLQDLLESQRIYQTLLKSTIEEQNLNLDMLRNFTTQLSTVTSLYGRSVSQGFVWRFNTPNIFVLILIILATLVMPAVIRILINKVLRQCPHSRRPLPLQIIIIIIIMVIVKWTPAV